MDNTEQLALLRRERSRTGIILDFDGTLAPIVRDRGAAAIVPGAPEVLSALAGLYPLVAFVSGRGAEDLFARVGVEGPRFFGLYGAEEMTTSGLVQSPMAAGWRLAVEQMYEEAVELIRSRGLTGCEAENKDLALSLHYRKSGLTEAPLPLTEWSHRAAAAHNFKVEVGRMVLELKPQSVSKAEAFERLVRTSGVHNVLVAGDDSADVGMMERSVSVVPGTLIRVGVVSAEAPAGMLENSDLQVGSPQEVVELLKRLL